MSRGDRDALLKVARLREKALKSEADQRAAELRADLEGQLSTVFEADDERWRRQVAELQKLADDLNKKLRAEVVAEGRPANFAPAVSVDFYGRGENAIKKRREELRVAGQATIEAQRKAVHTWIERQHASLASEIVAGALESAAAKAFLEALPAIETLLPKVSLAQIEIDRQKP